VKKEVLTYAKAMERLEQIVSRLESGETSVDELSAAVKEGVELVTWCRNKLRTAQQEVEAALAGLDAQPENAKPEKNNARAGDRDSTPRPASPGLFGAEESGDDDETVANPLE